MLLPFDVCYCPQAAHVELIQLFNVTTVNDVNARLGQANAAFGRLRKRLWGNHGITLAKKVAVYKAVVVTTLLYGCEAWTVYINLLIY